MFIQKKLKVVVWANVTQHFLIQAFCMIARNLLQCSLVEKSLCYHKMVHHKCMCGFVVVWGLGFFNNNECSLEIIICHPKTFWFSLLFRAFFTF